MRTILESNLTVENNQVFIMITIQHNTKIQITTLHEKTAIANSPSPSTTGEVTQVNSLHIHVLIMIFCYSRLQQSLQEYSQLI